MKCWQVDRTEVFVSTKKDLGAVQKWSSVWKMKKK